MTTPLVAQAATDPRAGCEGIVALEARLEPWQRRLCLAPGRIGAWMAQHGSPINLIDPSPMARNAAELQRAAAPFGLDLAIFFARKANKALCLVDEARRLGLGVDLAGERELEQVLRRGVPGEALVMTAAVKPRGLLDLCLSSETTVVLDNRDERDQLAGRAHAMAREARVALRLAPDLGHDRPQSRFGFDLDEAISAGNDWPATLRIDGVHFHLDGYEPDDRVVAMAEALRLVDALRKRGHEPRFIDIGGGIPMSYLDDPEPWRRFWDEHRAGLLGRREPLTFGKHGLGLIAHAGEVIGRPGTYPFHQPLIRGPWLTRILSARLPSGGATDTVAAGLAERGLELRCEPGRALLDGCGMTAARVAFRKLRRDGTVMVGVEMNRTQCRSTSEDFLVDPLLIRPDPTGHGGAADIVSTGPIEGYLVGAYCIERELLTWRRLRFPTGVRVDDIVIFPNTAGYMMHILESSSHQIPLARNLVVGPGDTARLDPIDRAE